MTTAEYLRYATNFLDEQSIDSARLDSLLLMEFVLGTDRAKLLAYPEVVISAKQLKVLNRLLSKRAKHIPIAYITQSSEFYGRSFYINSNVLEPRPESETMIDLLKELRIAGSIYLADIGTGSGALGITTALELPSVRVDLIDIDREALKVAKRNVVLHTIDANAFLGDLLINNDAPYDILLCNLPYIPDGFSINLAASHEPRIAIFGGKDGLDIYRKLFKILRYRQHKPLYLLIESLPPSHQKLIDLASKSGYELDKSQDFIQVFKRTTK